jgi:hypothetical protein
MARRVKPYCLVALLAALAGCSNFGRPQRPAWRGQEEAACLAQKRVRASDFVRPLGAVDGPGVCGMDHGFKVIALAEGAISLAQPVTLACPAIAEADRWIVEKVMPAAQARFGSALVGLTSTGGYSCRGMNNQPGARLSEHAFGNGFDVGGFKLADGRVITVAKHWKSADEQEQAFLRDVFADACESFTTVLGPGADAFHFDHFHLDLAQHGGASSGLRRICRPKPDRAPLPTRKDGLPDPPELEEELDVARGPGGGSLALGAPPAPLARLALTRPSPVRPSQTLARTPAPAPLRAPAGTLREDGAFEPDEEASDALSTSSLRAASVKPAARAGVLRQGLPLAKERPGPSRAASAKP